MGTRNLTMITLKGKRRVAQYCQWDGYPTGQGQTIAEFLHSKEFDLASFKAIVDKIKLATAKDEKTIEKLSSETLLKEYPQFHRDTGADILKHIQGGYIKKVVDSSEFLLDGLFCEWAYDVDLDKEVVRVYKGGDNLVKTIKFEDFKPKSMQKLQKELYRD